MASVVVGSVGLSSSSLGVCNISTANRKSGSGGKFNRTVRVRAESINPEIRKSEEKVVDSVDLTQLSKPITPYCRCWRSKTFPLCDGSHVKHNKATGDNVGPLLLKKES